MSGEWFHATAHEVSAALVKGETTSLEVTTACLERIDAVDGKVKAYVDVWSDAALAKARQADERIRIGEDVTPLTGVPIALKDVLCTREGFTTCCSRILAGYRSPYDATAVERLDKAGAVFLGKLNMDEFAMGSSTENSAVQVTRNPWDLERVPGGSSGGCAASVASGTSILAIGSDTGGSVRQPASFCGCVGMKPTYGRISRFGLVAFASSLDQIGPVTRDVHDCALALNALCGHDSRDSTSTDVATPDFAAVLGRDVKGLRIGMPKEYFTPALTGDTRARVESAIQTLAGLGAEVVEVALPRTEYAIATYYIICMAEASANLARFDGVRYGYRSPNARDMRGMYHMSKSEGFGPEVQRRILLGAYVLSSGYYDAYYLKAQKARHLIRQDFAAAFEKCDVIAAPVSPSPAFRIGEKTADPLEMYLGDIYTISVNLAALPGISVPCGLTAEGLPVGLQLIGRHFDEETLLRASYAYEQAAGPSGYPPLG